MRLTGEVRQHMIPGVVLLAESPIADVTAVGPDAAVNKLVGFQISRSRKRFVAQGAFVRLVLGKRIKPAMMETNRILGVFSLDTPTFFSCIPAALLPCYGSFCGSRGCSTP